MNASSIALFNWVKENDGANFTAQDIADATGIGVKSVNGIVTAAFQRHKNGDGEVEPLMERIPAEIEVKNEDGAVVHKAVKFIRLTDAGRAFDIDTVETK
jgi:hypothetical protein